MIMVWNVLIIFCIFDIFGGLWGRYCECFVFGIYCDGCNCVNCCNNSEYEVVR